MALSAAQTNQGVAVGWHRLVRPFIEESKLVRFTDIELPAAGGYYLTWNDNRDLSQGAQVLRARLLETAARETTDLVQCLRQHATGMVA